MQRFCVTQGNELVNILPCHETAICKTKSDCSDLLLHWPAFIHDSTVVSWPRIRSTVYQSLSMDIVPVPKQTANQCRYFLMDIVPVPKQTANRSRYFSILT